MGLINLMYRLHSRSRTSPFVMPLLIEMTFFFSMNSINKTPFCLRHNVVVQTVINVSGMVSCVLLSYSLNTRLTLIWLKHFFFSSFSKLAGIPSVTCTLGMPRTRVRWLPWLTSSTSQTLTQSYERKYNTVKKSSLVLDSKLFKLKVQEPSIAYWGYGAPQMVLPWFQIQFFLS